MPEVNLASIRDYEPDLVILNLDILTLARYESHMRIVVISEAPAKSAEVICFYGTVRRNIEFYECVAFKACVVIDFMIFLSDEAFCTAFVYPYATDSP